MLSELSVRDFALIGELRLSLGPGFAVFTGETGAGKSIIVDALSTALGERADAELVRTGAQEAEIEAVFEAAHNPAARAALGEAGIPLEDDGLIILRRVVSASGRSRCWLNGRACTLGALRAVGDCLVDIHGQHEHQALIRESNHLEYLDTFAGPEHLATRCRFQSVMTELAAARADLAAHVAAERERFQKLDLLRFQVEEINAAGLAPGEEAALQAERSVLANAETLRLGALEAHDALDADIEGGVSALGALQMAKERLDELAHLDSTLGDAAQAVTRAAYEAEDVVRQLSAYVEQIEANPRRLEQIEERLDLIGRLKRKYGDSIEDVLKLRDAAATEVDAFEHSEERQAELQQQVQGLQQEAAALAEQLSATRQRLAAELEKAVMREVRPLGMQGATVEVVLGRTPTAEGLTLSDGVTYAADRRGVDQSHFALSTNRGEPVKPLSRIAAGGELSRLMLALKSMCSRAAEIETMIFDEIDAGIGGRTAHAVGRKLAQLAQRSQVLCVTHLPQIARLADQQIRVGKRTVRGRTIVEAHALAEEQRVLELVRMLGADAEDAAAVEHAAELLRTGMQERAGMRKAGVA